VNILVTGAGCGIGEATARLLTSRGDKVVVSDIDADAAARVGVETGSFHLQLDVRSRESVREAIAAAEAAIGPLEGWVSNAGVSTMISFLEMPDAEWERMLAVNLSGVFYCGQEFARHLVSAGRAGAIVNVASMAAKQGNVPYLSHYIATKFGVVGLTQAMAYELGPRGIRVNSVCPGWVATSMQERELVWEAELRGVTPEQVKQGFIDNTPLGRVETGEDVARTIAFLLGPDAVFVTGEALNINGGAFMD
jgi:NAD(P)-dependent dehydrogenase (short-subunit alcohol dehydrogenase family)